MELRHLRYFVAVAHALSFTKAAQKLRIAQPALSRQIQQLEEEMGVKLLRRDRRQTELTETGHAFLKEACLLLEQSQRAIQIAQKTDRLGSGTLNLGYVWSLFYSLVPEAIQKLRTLLPEISVNLFDLTAVQQAEALVARRLDAGFIGFAHEPDAAGLAKRKVGTCSFLAALPRQHPAARKSKVALKSLQNDFFLMISHQSYPGASRFVSEACQLAGFRPKILQTVERGYTILGLVATNCGVALLPMPLRHLPHPGVVFRPLIEPPRGDLFLAWNPSRPAPALDALVNLFPL